MKRISALVGVILGLMLLPGVAAAQSSSTCEQYNPQLCSSVNATTATTPTTPSSDSSGTANSASTLPFTGLDVVLLVAGGGALLAAGFVVRRVSRRLN